MVDTTQTTTEKKLTQSDIRGVFQRQGYAENRRSHERLGVKELQVTANSLFTSFVVLRVEATNCRYHREAETQCLHTFEVP